MIQTRKSIALSVFLPYHIVQTGGLSPRNKKAKIVSGQINTKCQSGRLW